MIKDNKESNSEKFVEMLNNINSAKEKKKTIAKYVEGVLDAASTLTEIGVCMYDLKKILLTSSEQVVKRELKGHYCKVDEDKTKGQFYLTGSQSIKLMKNIGDSLAGRAGIIKMLGLSMRELDSVGYRETFKPTMAHVEEMSTKAPAFDYERIISRVHKGFFPELYETESDLKDWADYYSSYFQTYIEKDIKDVLNIRDESAFIKFVKATASLTGEMLNYSTIAEICGKDVSTVKAWMSVLESSGLVYLLELYYNNFNKRLIKTPKLYFLDTGLVSWLLGWNTPEQLVVGAMWGHIFETFVFAEILKSFYNDGNVIPPLFYYRDKDKNEIDLIVEDGSILHPIEIKTTSDPNKSMAKAFRCIENIPGKTAGQGAIICLTK